MLVIIAGFHRSGTSLLAQLMHHAGLYLGEELLGASRHNPFGFFEDVEIIDIHDTILADNGRSWQSTTELIPFVNDDVWRRMERLIARRQALGRPWGFKDPRVCLFLPLWKHLVPDARLVATYRDPGASALSLERRHAQDLVIRGGGAAENHWRFFREPDHALRLWVVHNRALLRSIRAFGDDAIVTSFTALEANHDIIGEVNTRWNVGLDPLPPATIFDPGAITADRPEYWSDDPVLRNEVERIWDRFVALERGATVAS